MQIKSTNTLKTVFVNTRKRKNEADATIVIGGGGLTGVELVGELADIMPKLAKSHGVNPKEVKLLLVEAGPKNPSSITRPLNRTCNY